MSHESYLLASDLDGTLIPPPSIGDDGGASEFARTVDSRPDVLLAYVTGRHRTLALEGIQRHGLPAPGVLVCDVGTSVFHLIDGVYEPDVGYRERMQQALGGVTGAALHDRLRHLPGLRLQEDEKQAEFKLSYYAPPGPEGTELVLRATTLLEESLGEANVIHSTDPVSGIGLLDVLPPGVAKDVAVRYLREQLSVSADRLVYAGDSGNDRAAMLSGFNAIVVGNAPAELKSSIRRQAEERGLGGRVYFAEEAYARGVLEGCRHFEIV